MGISKEALNRIYYLAKSPHLVKQLSEEDIEWIFQEAAELAEYYEAEEARRDEKEMRSERRRE